jgi:HEAT repeat protein
MVSRREVRMRWMLLALVVLPGCDEDATKRRERAAALGASYPDGTEHAGLLVDMLDDDDASVREVAARSLAALGRKGLAELTRCLKDKGDISHAAFAEMGEVYMRIGAALTCADLAVTMAAEQGPASRRAGAVNAILAACWGSADRDLMIDILAAARKDRDAGTTVRAAASLAVLGWTAAADVQPASSDDVKGLVPMVVDPGGDVSWPSCIAAATITLLRPRAEWPEHVADYPYGKGQEVDPRETPLTVENIRDTLRAFEKSAPGRPGDFARESGLFGALRGLRSKGSEAPAAKPELVALLAKERGTARVEVARTMLAVVPAESEAVARALGEAVREREPWSSREAIRLLAGMGPAARPAMPALVEVLAWSEEDDGAGEDPAGECARLGYAFQLALSSKRAAASILGHLAAKEAVPALKALASHRDARLRYRAATALRRIGNG